MEDNKELEMDFVTDEEIEVCEEETGKSGSILGKLALLGLAVAGGTLLYRRATKDKREAKQIKKLEKKGYLIYGPDEVELEVSNVIDMDDID